VSLGFSRLRQMHWPSGKFQRLLADHGVVFDEALRRRLGQCGDGELPLCHNGAFAPTGSIQYENS
jgi:hypothetical protein